MPLIRFAADAFSVVTICLVCIAAFLGLLCVYHTIHFQLRIRKRGFFQLNYFNGPWFIRIAVILVAIWWGLAEIARLTLLKGSGRLFPSIRWQENICKYYILSNLGLAEPSMFLMLVFLLHASFQKRELGTLSPQWNRKTFVYVLLFSLPVFVMQLALILVGPKFAMVKGNPRIKLVKFITSSSTNEDISICTYPLVSTMILGLFHALLICYTCYVGTKVVSLVINKGLRLRVYLLVAAVVTFLPLRVLLLGLSVLPHKGHVLFEAIVFLAFLSLLVCVALGVCMLVYFPVSDSLALRDIGYIGMGIGMEECPYDDYYNDVTSLIGLDPSQLEWRNSDASAKHVSISFHSTIRDNLLASGTEDVNIFSSSSHHIDASLGPSHLPDSPLVPRNRILKN